MKKRKMVLVAMPALICLVLLCVLYYVIGRTTDRHTAQTLYEVELAINRYSETHRDSNGFSTGPERLSLLNIPTKGLHGYKLGETAPFGFQYTVCANYFLPTTSYDGTLGPSDDTPYMHHHIGRQCYTVAVGVEPGVTEN